MALDIHGPQQVARLEIDKDSNRAGLFQADSDSLLEPPEGGEDRAPEVATQADPGKAGGFLSVLSNLNFLALWGGQICSQLADKMFLVLMIMLISAHFQQGPSQSINAWVSPVLVASTLPAVLFGTVAGVYVDRWAKKPVLVGSNLLRGGLLVLTPLLFWVGGSLWGIPISFLGLLVLTFVESVLTQFFAPAEQSALPLLVERRDLLAANSLYATTMMAALILGFAIGEPLLTLATHLAQQLGLGADWGPVLLVGGSYLLAGTLLLLPRTGLADRGNGSVESHLWEDIRVGLRYIRHTPSIRVALVRIIGLYSIFAALTVLAIRMAELMPGLEATQFGFLLAAAGVGMGVGAFVVGQSGQHVRRSLWATLGSLGVVAALFALSWTTQRLWPSLGLIAGVGFAGALVGVPMQTLIQEQTPEELRGKVFGLQNNLTNIALSLPLVLAGMAETYLGLQPVLWGLAGLAAAGSLLTWRLGLEP